jgi:hypothetical protein
MRMKTLLLTVLVCGLLSSSAFAQEGLEKKQWSRVAASGTNQRISFFHALHPDCTASGNINVRVIKQPEQGTVEITPTMSFPSYPKENIRSKCNQQKVRGIQVNYKSAEKYVGNDTLDLLILYPNGLLGKFITISASDDDKDKKLALRIAKEGAMTRAEIARVLKSLPSID